MMSISYFRLSHETVDRGMSNKNRISEMEGVLCLTDNDIAIRTAIIHVALNEGTYTVLTLTHQTPECN